MIVHCSYSEGIIKKVATNLALSLQVYKDEALEGGV